MQYTFDLTATTQTTVKRLLARAGVSHRLFLKLADSGNIWLNEQLTRNSPVTSGDRIRFALPPSETVTPSDGSLEVVKELANWLIVAKPAGLASVPGPSNPTDSLVNRAAGYMAQQGVTGPAPAIMTRLDRDTTGLVLIAKHPYAQGRLDAAQTPIDKTYLALVSGTPQPLQGTIDLPLGKAGDGIHREVQPAGQRAVTDYKVIESQNGYSLVQIKLLTGRTHQIRVHFAHLGWPLVGDALYGGDTAVASTQLLQAHALGFVDPFTAETVSATLPVPVEMVALLGN